MAHSRANCNRVDEARPARSKRPPDWVHQGPCSWRCRFPAIDPVADRHRPAARSAGTRSPISPGCSAAGATLGASPDGRRSGAACAARAAPDIDDLLTWMILGVILGGRLGYVLFYNLGAISPRIR